MTRHHHIRVLLGSCWLPAYSRLPSLLRTLPKSALSQSRTTNSGERFPARRSPTTGAGCRGRTLRVRSDDELHVRSLDTAVTLTVPNASGAEFSGDGAWAAFFISAPFLEAERLERDGEDVPQQVGLMELRTGDVRTWDDADSFGF